MASRVMHVVNNLGQGGLENGLVRVINGLDRNRFEHVVCTIRGLGPNADRLPHDRVHLVTLAPHGHTRVQTPALVRTIRRFQPDVVHSRNWGAIEAVIAARWAGVARVVHSEHGLEESASAVGPRRKSWFRRVAYELSDRVFTVSGHLRELYAARTGFPAQRIGVIHNGVDRSVFSPDALSRARVRRELGVSDTDFCIGCVANLVPVKNHITLLEAMQQLSAETPRCRLVLVGDGQERPALERMVRERPSLAERVMFLGTSGRVAELLRAFDVFVLPSLSEGICNSLLEAMATGVPVIATEVGGNAEVIEDGRSGLLIPVRDVAALTRQLRRISENSELERNIRCGAMARVRDHFSMDSMLEAYEMLYCGLQPHRQAAGLMVT
jgi:sugar transferase (PEP-CTERM/EpsH1 system associated)